MSVKLPAEPVPPSLSEVAPMPCACIPAFVDLIILRIAARQ